MLRRAPRSVLAALALGATAFALSATAPLAASASQGSVPSEVARYVADSDGLVARLADLVGVDASGKGIDFSAGATIGQLNRVHSFTAAFLAGESTDEAIELANLWSAPLIIGEQPLGLATIWINPATNAPDLADFVQDADLAVALSDLPAEVSLIYDASVGAWFTLNGERLTTVSPGDSGLDGEFPLTVYQRELIDRSSDVQDAAAQRSASLGQGTVIATIIVVITLVMVVVVLSLPKRNPGEPPEASAPQSPSPPSTTESAP